MSVILSYSIWIVFSAISGTIEAFHFWKWKHRFKYEHQVFTVVRAIVAALILYFTSGITLDSLLYGLGFMMVFSFFHNGFLYSIGKRLGKDYPKGFFDKAKNSSALINLDFIMRTILFALGTLLIFAINL